MRRLTIPLLLATLVLPYARAPLCEAGSHEHGEHHAMAGLPTLVESPVEGAGAGRDCHSLMGCAVVLQASLPLGTTSFRSFAHDSNVALAGAAFQLRSRASPDTPPPKTV
ncbi:MAG: hypothetical protein F4164_05885 [Gemmatimonadales bacterium]|nr:hypothetical protein [Gemmatimonadales bacterium]MYG48901.1 hypothetical protein [Gemmatimonadales bacterium]MYK02887.1 hypothetical protein [Candidatus Palauibacter ramosifaciens]